jgi:hypothetical protein
MRGCAVIVKVVMQIRDFSGTESQDNAGSTARRCRFVPISA